MNIKADEVASLKALDKEHVWHHITPTAAAKAGVPLFVRGEGLQLWDSEGKEYLDASSGGVWVTNVGYGRREIADAVHEQLCALNYFSGAAATKPGALFADALIDKMPGMSRVYYSSSGSEANEKAFKMVRQIAAKHYGGKKHKILFRERDYHGTTITALSASGQNERREQFGPFTPGFVEFPHCLEYRNQYGNDVDYGVRAAEAMEEVILREGADTVGAVILEPITAGGGIILPPQGYWEKIREICDKYNVLLIIDEVVCGLGRTGAWFGYQHYGIKPDMVTMAKGVASGYAPISCTVTTEKVYELLSEAEGDHLGFFRDISTFGGCTSAPAAALKNMEILERENLIENSARMGERLLAGFETLKAKHPIIGDVRGKGLFCGIEMVADRETREPAHESLSAAVAARCKELGLLIGRTNRSIAGYNNVLNFAPALVITEAQVDRIIEVLDQAFSEVCA
ncbi:aspartate aminotransferase family protein [Marinobacterium mangrovicola]|uniref:Taurine-pyruvate aminotransferase n=1 Tax=Marinobacterium mangrovicola TaxID=1476959 RepID=A0A4R1GCV3_9GAMM|nr:aminotransferase class III-fold pyridoxal phosphate-dependent enzyme [Marinobacterium mangrovicola]TCK03549.1 taurine-pyruvate aminotransferase [Marinobacterium mangrovicola]